MEITVSKLKLTKSRIDQIETTSVFNLISSGKSRNAIILGWVLLKTAKFTSRYCIIQDGDKYCKVRKVSKVSSEKKLVQISGSGEARELTHFQISYVDNNFPDSQIRPNIDEEENLKFGAELRRFCNQLSSCDQIYY